MGSPCFIEYEILNAAREYIYHQVHLSSHSIFGIVILYSHSQFFVNIEKWSSQTF